ncbi:hypothetical protein ZOSMA_8G01970 [Zostera marina]|uniref:Rit1 N-terminal domain-containing protein n=1 Tax=Zostera marina TaxID=29655 RepID=A0A0K9NKA5_ZOSMR|nr:hypothetical protein ZOSMA_8G01970 [Zostera marina]
MSEFSWNYIPGAGDDEESWARGLTPDIFCKNAFDIISCGPDLCNQKVAQLIEMNRVYRAQRGEVADQIIINSTLKKKSLRERIRYGVLQGLNCKYFKF